MDNAKLHGSVQFRRRDVYGPSEFAHSRQRYNRHFGRARHVGRFWAARVRYGWTIPVTYAILAVRFYPKITTILPYYVMVRSFHLLFTVTAVIIAHVSITLPLVVLIMITFFNRDPEGSRRSRGHGRVLGVVVFSSRHIAARPARTGDKCHPNRDVLLERVPHRLECDRSNVTDVASADSTFMTDKGTNLGQLSAVAVVVVLPIALFILVTQRSLVRGLTLGAVKESASRQSRSRSACGDRRGERDRAVHRAALCRQGLYRNFRQQG